MKKKPPVKKHMLDAKKAIKAIMQENLRDISQAMIAQIMSKAKKLTPSNMLDAIKNVDQPGINSYKSLLKTALSVISFDAIQQIRKEIPKARHVKLCEIKVNLDAPMGYTKDGQTVYHLDEFDSLPPKVQNKIANETTLITETQLNDLEKEIYFQFLSSYDSTDSGMILQKDLEDSAEDYFEGSAIDSGAGLVAAEIINEARDAFMSNEEVAKQIDALQFVNGDPVTTICTSLDGVIFAPDDPLADRFQPPFHWNCKTYVIPLVDAEESDIEDLSDYAGLESEIQFSESESKVIRLLEDMRNHVHG